MARRGTVESGRQGVPVLLTLHPAHILRTPDPAAQARLRELLRSDLAAARERAGLALPAAQAGEAGQGAA